MSHAQAVPFLLAAPFIVGLELMLAVFVGWTSRHPAARWLVGVLVIGATANFAVLWPDAGSTVTVTGERAEEPPRVFTALHYVYTVAGRGLELTEAGRRILSYAEEIFSLGDELLEFLGVADIYITPYLNQAQITSGTLAYAFGCGKAVLSTPYWHAEELLLFGRSV